VFAKSEYIDGQTLFPNGFLVDATKEQVDVSIHTGDKGLIGWRDPSIKRFGILSCTFAGIHLLSGFALYWYLNSLVQVPQGTS